MSAVAAAVGVAGIGGALIGAGASRDAAASASNSANSANVLQKQMFDTQQANMQPYMDAGKNALGQLQTKDSEGNTILDPNLTKKFTMGDFQQDPGYQFQLDQGMGAMQRSAAAAGMINSTGTMQNLNNYAQGMANTDYQQALSNFTNNQQQRYNMLSGVAGMGNTANATSAQLSGNTANAMSSNMMSAGQAGSAAAMAGGGAIAGGMNSAANGFMNMSMMNKMFPGGNTGNGTTPPPQNLWAGSDAGSSSVIKSIG